MGLEGAAYASLVAQMWIFIWALVFLLKKSPFKLKFLKEIHMEMTNLVYLTLNMMARTLVLNITFFVSNRYATGYGKSFLAAHGIAINIWLFSAFFIDGFANAGNAIAGKLLGEKDGKGIYDLGKQVRKISLKISLILALVYLMLYPVICSFFTDKITVIAIFNTFFWLVIISQPVNAFAFSLDGIFKGLGKAKFLRNVLLVATFLGFLPVLFVTDYLGWKIFSIWTAFLVWMLVRAGALILQLKKEFG